jgi:hypothetical protein
MTVIAIVSTATSQVHEGWEDSIPFSVVVGTGSTVVLVLVMVNVVSVTVTVVAMTTFVTCCAALLAADGRAQYWPMQIVGVGRSGGKLQ